MQFRPYLKIGKHFIKDKTIMIWLGFTHKCPILSYFWAIFNKELNLEKKVWKFIFNPKMKNI